MARTIRLPNEPPRPTWYRILVNSHWIVLGFIVLFLIALFFWPLLALPPILLGLLLLCAGTLIALGYFHILINAFWTHLAYAPKGKTILIVYSDSPKWKDRIENAWLPPLREKAITLNWSKRHEWNLQDPAIELFHAIAKTNTTGRGPTKHTPGYLEYCPLAVSFSPWWKPRTLRFWKAFRLAKKGKTQLLEKMENELLAWRTKQPN